jgi:hypothetical protein
MFEARCPGRHRASRPQACRGCHLRPCAAKLHIAEQPLPYRNGVPLLPIGPNAGRVIRIVSQPRDTHAVSAAVVMLLAGPDQPDGRLAPCDAHIGADAVINGARHLSMIG